MARRKHTAADTDYKVVSDGLQDRDGWRTPQPILDCARKLMGGQIKYDFCTDSENPTQAFHYGTPGTPIADLATRAPYYLADGQFLDTWKNPPFSTRNWWVRWFSTWVESGVLLVANETKPAWDFAYQHGWVCIRPRARIAFDLPPRLNVPNMKRPGGPTVLFAKGYDFAAVYDAFPFKATQTRQVEGHPGFTVWRSE